MAVDFSRQLSVKVNNTEYPMYGLDTAVTDGIAFQAQGATRYIEGSTQGEVAYRPMRIHKGGTTYRIGGVVLATVRIRISPHKNGSTYDTASYLQIYRGTLSTAFSVASTVKFEVYTSGGVRGINYSFTINANATTKTPEKIYYNVSYAGFYETRVTVTVNGLSYVGSLFFPEAPDIPSLADYITYDIPVHIPYSPFKTWAISEVTVKFNAITIESGVISNRVKFNGTGAITNSLAFPGQATITLKIPKDSGSDRIVTATLPANATSANSSTDSGAYTTKCKARVEVTIECGEFKETITINTVQGNLNHVRVAKLYIFRF